MRCTIKKASWWTKSFVAAVSVLAFACSGTSYDNADEDGGKRRDGGSNDASVGDANTDGQKPPHELSRIDVTPAEHIYELDLNAAGTIDYHAVGHYLDVGGQDLTDKVTWSISDESIGSFTGSTLNVVPSATSEARTALVTATLGDKRGQVQLTVVTYRKSGDKQDFFFVLPYNESEKTKPLDFKTDVRSLDVFFAMDTTGSMKDEIAHLKSSIINGIVTPMLAQIPDSQFGVGFFDDFPVRPYGAGPDQPFGLLTEITSDQEAIVNGVNRLDLHHGYDTPESMIEALYQVATGEGLSGPGGTSVPANNSGIGGVGFRRGTMPVVIAISDAPSHTVGEKGTPGYCESDYGESDYAGEVARVAHSREQTKNALTNICGRVVGVAAQDHDPTCGPVRDTTDFAVHTGARIPPSAWDVDGRPGGCAAGQCCTGMNGNGRDPDDDGLCPLVYLVDGDGNGLGEGIISGLKMLTRFATFDVLAKAEGGTTSKDGIALPEGKTTADFIKSIVAVSSDKPDTPSGLPDPVPSDDKFFNVTPGTTVEFNVNAKNDFFNATDKAVYFDATIKVSASGCTDLDERNVIILVPPKPLSIVR